MKRYKHLIFALLFLFSCGASQGTDISNFEEFSSAYNSSGVQDLVLTSSFVFTDNLGISPSNSFTLGNGGAAVLYEIGGLYSFISTYTSNDNWVTSAPVWTTNTYSGLRFSQVDFTAQSVLFENFKTFVLETDAHSAVSFTSATFINNEAVIKAGDYSTIYASHSFFLDNKGAGVYTGENSNAVFDDIVFSTTQGGIKIGANSIVEIKNSYFFSNAGQDFGAVYNLGSLTVRNTIFENNNSGNTSLNGGAIVNEGFLLLDSSDGDIVFSSNTFNYPSGWSVVQIPGSLFNAKNKEIVIRGTNSAVINDGVMGSGIIRNDGSSLILNGSGEYFTGTFIQESGTTTVSASGKMFAGTNLISNSTLTVFGAETAEVLGFSVRLGNNGKLNYFKGGDKNISVIYSNSVLFDGTDASALFGKDDSLTGMVRYNLAADIYSQSDTNKIIFGNSIVYFGSNLYNASGAVYSFSGSVLDIVYSSYVTRRVKFGNLESDNSALNFSIVVSADKRKKTDMNADLVFAKTSQGTLKTGNIRIFDVENDKLVIGSTFAVLVFSADMKFEASSGIIGTNNFLYEYETENSTGITVKVSSKADGDILKIINQSGYERRQFIFSDFNGKDPKIQTISADAGATSAGHLWVSGIDIFSSHSVLSGASSHSFFSVSNSGVELILENLTIESGFSAQSGSVLNFTSSLSTVSLNNIIFNGNTASQNGGAVYLNSTFIDVRDSSFSANTSGQNGGVFYLDYSTVAFYNKLTFVNNTAQNAGGAVYGANSYIKFQFFGAESTVSFSSNSAKFGGALYLQTSSADFNNKTILNSNFSSSSGGAVFAENARISFSEILISQNNKAALSGGSFYLISNSSLNFAKEAEFVRSSAGASGGIIYAANSNFNFENTVSITSSISGAAGGSFFLTNSTSVFNNTFNVLGSYSGGAGGSFYAVGNSYIFFAGGLDVKKSSAQGSGGFLYLNASTALFNSGAAFENAASKDSGGVFYINNGSYIEFDGNLNITRSSAANRGGAFYIENSSAVFKSALSFDYSTAVYGGHFYSKNSILIFDSNNNSINFSNGYSLNSGGALYFENSSASFTTVSLSVSNSISTRGAGGGLYLDNSVLFFYGENRDVSFNSNKSFLEGGGAFINESTAIFEMVSVSVNSNLSSASGGGFYVKSSSLVFESFNRNIDFNSNISRKSGGAIYLENSNIVSQSSMNRAAFNSNTALSSGGAVYIDRNSVFTIAMGGNSEFRSNVIASSMGAGGAIYNAGILNLDLSSGNISFGDNRAEWTSKDSKGQDVNERKDNDIFNAASGVINISGSSASFILEFNSGIAGSGTINQNSYGTVYIRGSQNSDWTGRFIQTTGTTMIEGNFLTKNGANTVLDGGILSLNSGSIISSYTNVSSGIYKTVFRLSAEATLRINSDKTFTEGMITAGTGGFGNIEAAGGNIYFEGDYSAFNGTFTQTNGSLVIISSKVFSGDKNIIQGTFEISSSAIANAGFGAGSYYLGEEGILSFDVSSQNYSGNSYFVLNAALDGLTSASGVTTYGRLNKKGTGNIEINNNNYSSFSFTNEGGGTTAVRMADFFKGYNYINSGYVIMDGSRFNDIIGTSTSTLELNSGGKLTIQTNGNHNLYSLKGGGEIRQNAGIFTVLNSEFSGQNHLSGANTAFNVTGNNFNFSVYLGTQTVFNNYNTGSDRASLHGRVNFTGDSATAYLGKDSSLNGYANYDLNEKIEAQYESNAGNKLIFDNSNVIFSNETRFIGSTTYSFANSVLDLTRRDREDARNIIFEHFENNNNKITLGIGFNSDGSIKSDKLSILNSAAVSTIGFESMRIFDANANMAVGTSSQIAVLDGLNFDSNKSGLYATTAFEYEFSIAANTNFIDINTIKRTDGHTLNKINIQNEGYRTFSFSSSIAYTIVGDLQDMAAGSFTVLGYNSYPSSSVLSGYGVYSFFRITEDNTYFYLSDLSIQNALTVSSGSALYIDNAKSTAVLNNVLLRDNVSKSNGGAVYSENAALTINKSQFINNKAGGTGGVFYLSNSSLSFRGETVFRDNYAALGGALYASSTYIDFDGNGTFYFEKNRGADGGGALSIEAGSSVSFNGYVYFTSNTSEGKGGAISADFSTIGFYKDGSSFIGNIAGDGGALYLTNQSGASFEATLYFTSNSALGNGGAFFSSNSFISLNENKTLEFLGNKTDISGGAMFFISFSSASLAGHVKFTSNSANRDGGAIYADNSFIEFDRSKNEEFYRNTARGNGGAISLINNSSFSFKGYSVFEGNSAGISGGAVNINHSYIEFSTESRSNFIYNRAVSNGGAINMSGGSTIAFYREITGFTSNTALGLGGAIYADNSFIDFNTENTIYFNYNTAIRNGGALSLLNGASAVFEGRDFRDISVYFEGNRSSSSAGGAIYAENSNLYFSSKTSVYFRENMSRTSGSAIALFRSGIVFEGRVEFSNSLSARLNGSNNFIYLDGSTISFNGTETVFTGTSSANGAAIAALNGSSVHFSGQNVRFEGFANIEADGGVLHRDAGSTISFSSWTNVTANKNTAKNGGFMKYDSGEAETFYANMSFSENTAREKGGALYVISGTTLIFAGEKVDFSGNKSNADGGAIYIDDSSFVDFSSSALTASNNYGINGGFMFLKNRNMDFYKSASFSENTAKETGGALRIENTTMSFENSLSLSGNKASGNGGGFYAVKSYLEIGKDASTQFSANVSSNSGGALYMDGSTFIFNNANSQFMTNYSKKDGGGIYLLNKSIAEFNGSIFYSSANIAQRGGAIYADNSILTFNNEQYSVFDSNRAEGEDASGGAVFAVNSAVLTFNSTTTYFQNNFAQGHGGAIYISSGAVINVKNANFINNTSGKEGGAIFIGGSGTLNYTVEDFKEVYVYQNVSEEAVLFGSKYREISHGIHIDQGGTLNLNLEGEHSLIHLIDIISSSKDAVFNIYGDGYARLYMAGDIYKMNLSGSVEFDLAAQATLKITTLTVSDNASLGLERDTRVFLDGDIFVNGNSELIMANGSFIVGAETGKGGRVHISSNASLNLKNDQFDSVVISTLIINGGTILLDAFSNSKYDQIAAVDYLKIEPNSKLKINTDLKNRDYRRKYYFLAVSNGKVDGTFALSDISVEDIFLSSYASYSLSELGEIYADYKLDYGVLFKNRITLVLDGDAPSITNIAATTPDMSFNQNSIAQNLDRLSVLYAETVTPDIVNSPGASFTAGDLDYIISIISEDFNDSERLEALSEIAPYFMANIFLSQSFRNSRNDLFSRIVQPGDYGGSYGTWARYLGGVTTFKSDRNSIGSLRHSHSGTLFGIDKFNDFYQIEYGFFGRYNSATILQGYSNATVENYTFGLYGGSFDDEVEMRTVLGVNTGRYEINRVIAPFGRTARSEFTSADASFDIEVSYLLSSGERVFKPFAGYNASLLHQPAIKEDGAESLNIEYNSQVLLRSSLRSGVSTNGTFFDGALNWNLMLGVDLILGGQVPKFSGRLQNTNLSFDYKGIDAGFITLETSINADYSISDSVSLYLGGTFKGGTVYQDYSGSFGIRYFLD